ncbi:hypothetical protein DTO013E5_8038 [Penicillium roqueforti]|uniref:Genomic scaffold, ProqFM164S04 n=1 Tax=Penicillium roqueforti (strain FM164) TaxID=1365484 RepID=W6R0X7_PENRF|nr:uncharacterized protein LCP9604111_7681 [Penicillium roqueforti]CDM35482.1 unnamed protein product [Penicillium roqueforti FM164]KAF9243298.1 hypothetical protein LCP9604111_7681 [Penicillium roqueforti]KAI1833838.1 hypothetical protein CBS147337_5393 [Penicillium roqueforti]KAI2685729.1 hypothetical protein CBS147355_1216 [Penicillium roqueforti]KAI2691918.1 hypothetical protein LCP963914a_12 [Penicillium roqueforti]
MNHLCGDRDGELFARSLVAFFAHFAASSDWSFEPSLPSSSDDPLGLEFLSRHPAFPRQIATEGLIPLLDNYIDRAISVFESTSDVRLTPPQCNLPPASSIYDIPQAPVFTMSQSIEDNMQTGPPGPKDLCQIASSCMLSAFNLRNAVKGAKDNLIRTATDRPTIPKSSIVSSAEYVFATVMFGGLWYFYASHSSVKPILDTWCSWLNDRVSGARAPPITTIPWLGSTKSLFTADTETDILATLWTFVTRGAGNLQPTGYQASFSEFYSMMALRAGVSFVACDGTLVVDVAVVVQTVAQIPNLGYDGMTGDQRGAAIFLNGDMGKAWATHFLAALRWYTICSPSAMGLSAIASGLYAYTSKRHGPGYWKYVRPRLICAQGHTSGFDLPVCIPSFWYDGGLEGCRPEPLHPCSHRPRPIYISPLIDAINAVSSITECETYDQWRSQIDTSVASVDSWLRDLATHGESDVLLRATAGAAPSFINLVSSTLAAVLDYD